MKLSFHGAAREVTGSCNLIETKAKKILVDCGMFQGEQFNENKNHDDFLFDPKELNAVIVSHAHLDHVGRLPLLIKNGYAGFFYATPATIELAELILDDALQVMRYNALKTGEPVLYDETDIAGVIGRFKKVDYYEKFEIDKDISFEFYDAGHIFGASFVEFNIEGKRIVFSGDIGNVNVPILRETDVMPGEVDLVVCESTYGDRIHETTEERQNIIQEQVQSAIDRGGTLMIPAFSLERTQELLYYLNDLIDRQKKLPRVPIFLDSPLAIKATEVYRKYPKYYDQEARKLYTQDDDLFQFPGLKMTLSTNESKEINHVPGPKIVIAGSGMMNGGRIIHHALRHLSDPTSTLLIVGYQSYGTLGRDILEGKSPVKILNQRVPVKCRVKAVGALSAHGDQEKLLDWISGGPSLPKKVILNHGEPLSSSALKKRLEKELNVAVEVAEGEREYVIGSIKY